MVVSIALGLIVGFAGIAAIVWTLFPRLLSAILVPRTPNPAFVPDCTTPNAPSNAVFGPGLTRGVVRAPLVTLAANTTLRITGDLTLISTGDLKIDGSILNGPSPAAGSDFSHNITLISLNGNVLIGANARIGFDNSTVISALALAAGANITGAPGKTAGWIKIVSQNGIVANAGQIVGFPGIAGQSATDAQPATAGPMAFFGQGLPASCASGGGGDGGHVLLCALDSIVNDGTVLAGNAGDGGIATSTAGNFADATAVGGPGGSGASIMLRGLANPGPV